MGDFFCSVEISRTLGEEKNMFKRIALSGNNLHMVNIIIFTSLNPIRKLEFHSTKYHSLWYLDWETTIIAARIECLLFKIFKYYY